MKLLFLFFTVVFSRFLTTAEIEHSSNFLPNKINVATSDTQPQTMSLNQSVTFLVTAETRVSVIVITPEYFDPDILSGISIFDGPDWNSTCLGTGYQLWKNKTQWVSTGKQMTVQFISDSKSDANKTIVVFQDYENTKQIVNYQGIICISEDYCEVDLNNRFGTSALMTYTNWDRSDTLSDLSYRQGTLDVFMGGVTKSRKNLITSYQDGDNSNSVLPQSFVGTFTTYVLNGNGSNVKILLKTDSYKYTSISKSIERKGFIATNHYTETVKNQYVAGSIQAPGALRVIFSFSIRCADMTENATFNVTVYSFRDEVVYDKHYNSRIQPALNQITQVLGQRLMITFDSKEDISKGLYIEYETLNSSSKFCVFVSILTVLLVALFS